MPVCGLGPLVSLAVLALARRREWLRAHALHGLVLAGLATVCVVGPWLLDFALEATGLPALGLAAVAVQLLAFAAYLALSLRAMLLAYRGGRATLRLWRAQRGGA